jgi:isopentenyl diphosphate isomerase/L-lactate dehydrogenase-like FMN-dependent dehydrogenase
MPGMGGVYDSKNFMANCRDYDLFPVVGGSLPSLRLAPITGAVQNVGYPEEKPFYADIIREALDAGLHLSIGDGYPDEKLLFGIEALKKQGAQGAVFIKPYPDPVFFERIEWSRGVASHIGIDIDSYNIVTMRNLAKLERKNANQLRQIARLVQVPFIIKGVFTPEDIALVEEVRPDIAVVSNHGGRVETAVGSTIQFLSDYGARLSKSCGELWIDGGIRKRRDLEVCAGFGVAEVMMGRPAISCLLRGRGELKKYAASLCEAPYAAVI